MSLLKNAFVVLCKLPFRPSGTTEVSAFATSLKTGKEWRFDCSFSVKIF
jgi:hypothetical protein